MIVTQTIDDLGTSELLDEHKVLWDDNALKQIYLIVEQNPDVYITQTSDDNEKTYMMLEYGSEESGFKTLEVLNPIALSSFESGRHWAAIQRYQLTDDTFVYDPEISPYSGCYPIFDGCRETKYQQIHGRYFGQVWKKIKDAEESEEGSISDSASEYSDLVYNRQLISDIEKAIEKAKEDGTDDKMIKLLKKQKVFDYSRVETKYGKYEIVSQKGCLLSFQTTTASVEGLGIEKGKTVYINFIYSQNMSDIQMVYHINQFDESKAVNETWPKYYDRCNKNFDHAFDTIKKMSDNKNINYPTGVAIQGGGYIASVCGISALQTANTIFGIAGLKEGGTVSFVSGTSGGAWGTTLFFKKNDFNMEDLKQMALHFNELKQCNIEDTVNDHTLLSFILTTLTKYKLTDIHQLNMAQNVSRINFDWKNFVEQSYKPIINDGDDLLFSWHIFPQEVTIIFPSCLLSESYVSDSEH